MSLVILAGLLFWSAPGWSQRVWKIDVTGSQFEPKEITVWPGDTLQFCNNGIWRRQPYSTQSYNRYSSRKPEIYEMLKKGECKEMKIQNPTKKWLKFTIRDAVNMDMKLKVNVNPSS